MGLKVHTTMNLDGSRLLERRTAGRWTGRKGSLRVEATGYMRLLVNIHLVELFLCVRMKLTFCVFVFYILIINHSLASHSNKRDKILLEGFRDLWVLV